MKTFVPEILGYEEFVLKDGKKYIYSKMAFILRISIDTVRSIYVCK